MFRFLFLLEIAKYYFQPFVLTLCLMSIFFASIMAIRQLDMKRIIAYSSIAHMNFALLGIFSYTIYGLIGGMLLMISHGLVSTALFLIIGVLYDRHHTRSFTYYSGITSVMPTFSFFFIIFILSNFSFPGSSNFCGEILIFVGLGQYVFKFILFWASLSTLLGLAVSILLYNRVMFGNLKFTANTVFKDLDRREFSLFLPLFYLNFLMGLYPNPLINTIYFSFKILL